jgi:hypothetical protein
MVGDLVRDLAGDLARDLARDLAQIARTTDRSEKAEDYSDAKVGSYRPASNIC